MKSRIFGVLTCVTFLLTFASYLQVVDTKFGPEDSTSGPLHNQTLRQNKPFAWFWQREAAKATSMVAVGFEGCPPCAKLKKETLTPLRKEGYRVRYTFTKNWDGPKVRRAPTLFYLDDDFEIIRVETGFQTAKHVKQYLTK